MGININPLGLLLHITLFKGAQPVPTISLSLRICSSDLNLTAPCFVVLLFVLSALHWDLLSHSNFSIHAAEASTGPPVSFTACPGTQPSAWHTESAC